MSGRTKSTIAALTAFSERTRGQLPAVKRKLKRKTGSPTEHQHQVAVCKWLTANNLLFASVPNGASYSGDQQSRYRQSAFLKAEGLKKGVPDLLIFSVPVEVVLIGGKRSRPCGVALEMKTPKGKVSPEQRKWLDLLEAEGWICLVGFGAEDAIEQLTALYK